MKAAVHIALLAVLLSGCEKVTYLSANLPAVPYYQINEDIVEFLATGDLGQRRSAYTAFLAALPEVANDSTGSGKFRITLDTTGRTLSVAFKEPPLNNVQWILQCRLLSPDETAAGDAKIGVRLALGNMQLNQESHSFSRQHALDVLARVKADLDIVLMKARQQTGNAVTVRWTLATPGA